MDCGPPGCSLPGIPQARILEWVPLPSPGDLPDLCLTYWQMDSLPLSHQEPVYLFTYLCIHLSLLFQG